MNGKFAPVDIRLGDLLAVMSGGSRIVIFNETGRNVFRGQAIFLQASGISPESRVNSLEMLWDMASKESYGKYMKIPGIESLRDDPPDQESERYETRVFWKISISTSDKTR